MKFRVRDLYQGHEITTPVSGTVLQRLYGADKDYFPHLDSTLPDYPQPNGDFLHRPGMATEKAFVDLTGAQIPLVTTPEDATTLLARFYAKYPDDQWSNFKKVVETYMSFGVFKVAVEEHDREDIEGFLRRVNIAVLGVDVVVQHVFVENFSTSAAEKARRFYKENILKQMLELSDGEDPRTIISTRGDWNAIGSPMLYKTYCEAWGILLETCPSPLTMESLDDFAVEDLKKVVDRLDTKMIQEAILQAAVLFLKREPNFAPEEA